MKTIITENERGLLVKNGKFVRMLKPGKFYTFGNNYVISNNITEMLPIDEIPVEALLGDKELAKSTVRVDVPDQNLALHFVNGKFKCVHKPGTYLFWNIFDEHTFMMADTSIPEISGDIPEYIFKHIPLNYYTKVEISAWQKGILFIDNVLQKTLEPGIYYFWNGLKKVEVKTVDTRLCQLEINGQELLTSDKVTLRINFVCHYKITDYIKAALEIEDFIGQLYVKAQMVLREYIAQYRMDELMANKDQIGAYVLTALRDVQDKYFVSIEDAGIKDVILPGEIRDIMNSVLVAEKQAQANVITRREEVASTRSLLNTAKLMDENQTLYKLKELEYLERICQHVGNITVGNGADLLSQLTTLLGNH